MKNYVPLFLLAVLAACSPETKQTAAPATVEEATIGGLHDRLCRPHPQAHP